MPDQNEVETDWDSQADLAVEANQAIDAPDVHESETLLSVRLQGTSFALTICIKCQTKSHLYGQTWQSELLNPVRSLRVIISVILIPLVWVYLDPEAQSSLLKTQ